MLAPPYRKQSTVALSVLHEDPMGRADGGAMSVQQRVALVATLVLGLVMVLQVLLAAGLPLGQAAWRGQYRVLPLGSGHLLDG